MSSSFSWVLQLCCSHAGCEYTQLVPSQGWCHPVRASPPSSLCLTVPSTASFCTKKPKEFWAAWPELSSCTQRNDRGLGLQAVGNCSAIPVCPVCHYWGREASPPWLTQAPSNVLPKCLCWLCCFPWCLCVPLSPQMHVTHGTSYRSKRPINVMFGDPKICSACWKSGDW